MSDNEATKGKAAGSGWTDRERLAYLVSLIEHSETKFNFKTAPLPAGRSVIACERMVGRLKNTLKAELEALKAGQPMPAGAASDTAAAATPKKAATPRKRKGKEAGADVDEEGAGSPKKRGRKPKKADVEAEEADDMAKAEVKAEAEAEEV